MSGEMSAFGTKRISLFALHMSANDPKRTLGLGPTRFRRVFVLDYFRIRANRGTFASADLTAS
jgi:hypothetical protein